MPHLIALPVQVAALALALDTILRAWASRGASFWGAGLADAGLRVATLAIAFGALAVINTWDFLTYALLLAGGVALAAARGVGARRVAAALKATVAVAIALMLAILLYAPFFLSFQAFYTQVKPLIDGVDGMRRTRLAEWLVIWGLFAFLAATCSLLALRPLLRRSVVARASPERRPLIALALGLLAEWSPVRSPGSGRWRRWRCCLASRARRSPSPRPRLPPFGAALIVVGLLAAAGVELVYVADFLQDTEWYRMNTVFKFYMQAWALLGCGVTGSLALLAPRVAWRGPRFGRALWLAALVVLLGPAGSFVVGGTQSRLQERFPVRPPGPTLDGMAFLDDNTFSWGPGSAPAQVNFADDHAAYDWLLAHATASRSSRQRPPRRILRACS